jgi:hypothetical protein
LVILTIKEIKRMEKELESPHPGTVKKVYKREKEE